MNKRTFKVPRRTADRYEALKLQAAILYIKHGKSAKEISDQLCLAPSTLSKWNKEGNWSALRPEMEILSEYKAANLYIVKGFTTAQISQMLSLPEITIKIWVMVNGWDVTKIVSTSKNLPADIVANFCMHFIGMFPKLVTEISMAQQSYIKKKIRKSTNPDKN